MTTWPLHHTTPTEPRTVTIACGNQRLHEKLCNDVLGMPEMITDERFTTIPLHVKNNDAQTAYIKR